MTIRRVLFDTHGVLQDVPGGWHGLMEPFLGERTAEFCAETWSDELPLLAGQGDYRPILREALQGYGVTESVDIVYEAVWHRIDASCYSYELGVAKPDPGFFVEAARRIGARSSRLAAVH